jgi:hypothetical protein
VETKWYQEIKPSDVGTVVIAKRISTYDASGNDTVAYVRTGIIEIVDDRPSINFGNIQHEYFDGNGTLIRSTETEYLVYGIDAGYTEDMDYIPEIENPWKRTFFRGEKTQLSPTYTTEYFWTPMHDYAQVCIDCMMKAEGLEQADFDADHAKRYAEAKKHGTIDIWLGTACELEITAFSKKPCDYCGSELAGERYKAMYTVNDNAINSMETYVMWTPMKWTSYKASI